MRHQHLLLWLRGLLLLSQQTDYCGVWPHWKPRTLQTEGCITRGGGGRGEGGGGRGNTWWTCG